MWNLKKKKKKKVQINLFTEKKKQIHRLRKQTYGYQRKDEEDKLGVWN